MSNASDSAIAQYALALAVHDQANTRYAAVCEQEEAAGPAPSDMADAVDERLNSAEEALGYASGLIEELAGDTFRVEYAYAKIQHCLWRLADVAEFDDDDLAAWSKQAHHLREQFALLEQLAQHGFLPSAWRNAADSTTRG